MPTPLLSIKNLRISFKHEKEWVEAVHGIDLEVFAGRALGLVGESGSGKSVSSLAVMRLLNERNSQIKADSIRLGDDEIKDFNESQMATVATICTGMAASMAAVLMCAGTKGKRSALPHSRIMIHQPMGGVEGQATEIEITAREIQKLKKELYEIIAKHSGQTYDKVWADSDRDYWMTAAEAKEYGMIDEVLIKNKQA